MGMRAVVITPKAKGTARLVERKQPTRRPGECLVRVLEVGIDATDRDVEKGEYGEAPPGEDVLVMGHESLGEVVECDSGDGPLREGDLVAPTVRRPCHESCPNCRNGASDFCVTGHFTERGIKQRHGYLREMFA